MFSEIISKRCWVVSPVQKFKDKVRKRIRRTMSQFMCSVAGFSIRHCDLESEEAGLHFRDGVHLSDVGFNIFNLDLQAMMELAVGRVIVDSHPIRGWTLMCS